MIFNHVHQWLRQKGVWLVAGSIVCVTVLAATGHGHAASSGADFNIQVSPSPLVVTLTPGTSKTAILTVRNLTNHQETLYPKLGGFSVNADSKNIQLLDEAPLGMSQWVVFSNPTINLGPGATQSVPVTFNTPANVGFSYTAAITLARHSDNTSAEKAVQLRGAVAVFMLLNIDRPDATRDLSITSFKSDRSHYAYLPAHFTVTIKNKGNVIDQPKGTLYIQRSVSSNTPLATMPLNSGSNYILPGTSRDFTNEWTSGFPVYTTGSTGKKHLSWDWKHLSDLRFGRYVAKVVAVYNDGHRDVPLTASYTFWVIPWALILIVLSVLIVLAMGILGWVKLFVKGTKKVRGYARHT